MFSLNPKCFSIGAMVFNFGEFAMQGMGLSAIVAILLNIV